MAANELYRIDEKYIKLDDLRETDNLSVEKLQEQLNTAKKYIDHVIRTIKHDGHLGTIQIDWILPDLEKALAAIGGDGFPVGLIVKNGLTKEELEGSDDE
ncbi:hypothetical protein GHI93_12690 [Lactococcus hircilactis]|uniref:Uncharacterized protein n=1 Tax=Lactococcus hircilactis TaxID=1494462 RepID=A0A7X1ZAH3_9LACT|nr:hypothetical protein [Lactococcus hircilactis]